ncbi:unnamed protein product [Rhizophagus irregularis]|nr:unnamed protein product [Rhizophagus irregularis]
MSYNFESVFDIILKYIYTDQINIANKTGTELLDLMIISDELMLKKLTKFTEKFIIKNQQRFLQNDPKLGSIRTINRLSGYLIWSKSFSRK